MAQMALLVVALCSVAFAQDTHWVSAWTGAPQLTEVANNPPAPLTGSAVRQVVHIGAGGKQLRVQLSNLFGNGPITVNLAHVAVCNTPLLTSSIDVSTDTPLAFAGAASVTIPQGGAVWSDALDFNLVALSNLSITIAFGTAPSGVTGHPGSRTTSYQQTGSSVVNAPDMATAQKADHWYIITGVDVMEATTFAGIVVLGDSITDGRGSTTNANDRWPDDLARRLKAGASTSNTSLVNQGIGGNCITRGGLGPTALARFARDVLGQSGVKWVIVFEGVNDIGGGVGADAITAAFDTMISQAHAQKLSIYGATITPFGSNGYYSPAHETARQSVNAYIRGGKFDGFIDFDAAVRDTSTPPRLLPVSVRRIFAYAYVLMHMPLRSLRLY